MQHLAVAVLLGRRRGARQRSGASTRRLDSPPSRQDRRREEGHPHRRCGCQYTGTAGKIETVQVAVYLVHAGLSGRYDHDICRDQVRRRRIVPTRGRRGTLHGTGLGTYRWVVERIFDWLHSVNRLRIRWCRRADIHEAFLKLACCRITHRQIGSLCQP